METNKQKNPFQQTDPENNHHHEISYDTTYIRCEEGLNSKASKMNGKQRKKAMCLCTWPCTHTLCKTVIMSTILDF